MERRQILPIWDKEIEKTSLLRLDPHVYHLQSNYTSEYLLKPPTQTGHLNHYLLFFFRPDLFFYSLQSNWPVTQRNRTSYINYNTQLIGKDYKFVLRSDMIKRRKCQRSVWASKCKLLGEDSLIRSNSFFRWTYFRIPLIWVALYYKCRNYFYKV